MSCQKTSQPYRGKLFVVSIGELAITVWIAATDTTVAAAFVVLLRIR